MMKYIIGVLAVIVLIVIAAVLVFTDPSPKSADEAIIPARLIDYVDKNSSVTYTRYGGVVAEEERTAIRIKITPFARQIDILDGYTEKVVRSKTLPNNSEAYEVFTRALAISGYDNAKEPLFKDERGVCSQGIIAVYQFNDEDNNQLKRTWSSTCSAKQGSFAGNSTAVMVLFREQFPNYSDVVRGVRL
jgi:hypothetical protein